MSMAPASEERYIIREAIPEDNERLIDLARRCPMQGQFEMYSDRYPDFFATNRLQGERSLIYVAEHAETQAIVACIAFTEKHERRDGKDVIVLHVGDLRTDPSIRRTRVAGRLVQLYKELLGTGRYDHGVAEFLQGNEKAIRLNKIMGEAFEIGAEGQVNFYQLLPVRNYKASKVYHYRPAAEGDKAAIVELLEASYGTTPGAPAFSIPWLEARLLEHPSFQLQDIWLALNQAGEILAIAGLWDQSSFRRTIASRYTRAMKNGVRLLAMLGLLWKLPPIPREGEALRYAFVRWPAARPGHADALNALCRHLLGKVRREGNYQFLSIGFHELDPLQHALDGLTKITERIQVFSHWLKDSESHRALPVPASQKSPGRRFVDLALI